MIHGEPGYNQPTLENPDELRHLLQQVSAGDRRAFLALYDRFASRVYGLALHMLRDQMAAEEVAQETFLKLWTRADTFRPEKGTFVAWLLTIARRTALDRIRLESRRPAIAEPPPEIEDWSHLPHPNSTSDEARWGTVRFALAQLPQEQQEVISLAFYYGLSQSQISEQLNIPLGTVKTRVRLGMDKLREALGYFEE
jgi:RNA polymerase sigma-70 factor (ECF subfamily)